jgi:hypothetical protein
MQAEKHHYCKSTAQLEVRLILGIFCHKVLPELKSTRPVSTGRLRFCMEVNDV